MTLPYLYSYVAKQHGPGPIVGDAGRQFYRWFGWYDVPIGVTAVTNPADLTTYLLMFGEGLTSATPEIPADDWTTVATGTIGVSNYFLLRRVTGPSEPDLCRINFTPPDNELITLGIAVANAEAEVVAPPLLDIGDTAATDSLTVPPGNVLSAHMWAGRQDPTAGDQWVPDWTDFPDGHRTTWSQANMLYAGSIGDLVSVTSAPGKPATIVTDGQDNIGIQFLFSDIPITLGGWGVGMVRMGGN